MSDARPPCPRCGRQNPGLARFCLRCGTDLGAGDRSSAGRAGRFAANPGEPVLSFNLISSIMPNASSGVTQTYRFAVVVAVLIPLAAALLGLMPFAFVTAAFAVPIVYVVYLADVNQWRDQPMLVLVLGAGVSGALALGFTLVWRGELLGGVLVDRAQAGELLVLALIVPAGGAEASAALDLGSGVSVVPAEGFETLVQGEGLLRLGRGGSFFTVEVEPLDAGDSAESLLAVWAQDRLPGDIGQATPTRPRPVNPPSPSVVSAATAEYRGVVVGPQVNSPVEGVAAAFVDQNSLGILVTTVDTRGGYGSSHAAYEQMVTSILRGLA